jgi:hypothetical protein
MMTVDKQRLIQIELEILSKWELISGIQLQIARLEDERNQMQAEFKFPSECPHRRASENTAT